MGTLGKLLIHPVDFDCNLACGYCYNGSHCAAVEVPNRTIPIDMLARLFEEAGGLLEGKILTVIWHGGEPLLAGKAFYRAALRVQAEVAVEGGFQVRNCVQSNGTLIDGEWADLFEEFSVAPSVSLDGPSELHDLARRYPDGRGSYEEAFRGYSLLRSRGIRTGLLVVISKTNVQAPDAIWDWILKQGIKTMDFLPCLEPERVREGQGLFTVSEREFAAFSTRLFDLWYKHGDPSVRIRTFRDAVKGMLGGRVQVCSWKGGCLSHISVDPEGNVFPCGRYHCFPETSFGNIGRSSLFEVVGGEVAQHIHGSIADAQAQCAHCQWFPICHAGCPFLKYALHGRWDAPYVHCESRRILFQHIHERLSL